MADIRINALATTAASTASDDFIAVDGSANGTRKLNAYSPTFGGNLTVSGTGAFGGAVSTLVSTNGENRLSNRNTSAGAAAYSSFLLGNDSALNLGALYALSSGYTTSAQYVADTLVIESSRAAGMGISTTNGGPIKFWHSGVNTATFTSSATTFGGNLTVSGTSSLTGNVTLGLAANLNLLGNDPGNAYIQLNNSLSSGNSKYRLTAGVNGVRQEGFSIYEVTTAATLLNLHQNGNLCLGTTNDSSNGKLQLATHTTSAGGIGFGTDVALFHRATGVGLTLSSIGSTTPYFTLDANGTNVLDIFGLSSDVYFDQRVAGKSLFFRTNGATLALTLDSSQNATFAGTVTANNVITATTANDYGLTGIRTSAATNATARAALIQHTTSGDMVDGQGAAVAFALRDSAAVTNIVGDITCVRAGADNTGDIVFRPYTTGTANERMRVRANGRINFASLPTSSAGLAAGDIWNDGGTLKIV